jgi:type IX secretion system PorP/SprF family membrane protein
LVSFVSLGQTTFIKPISLALDATPIKQMKISFRIFFMLALASWFKSPVVSQQLPVFSQYYSNEFLINPSVAGYDGRTVINLAARKQWVGFTKYTPSSYIISLQGRILKTSYSLKSAAKGNILRKGNKGRVGLGGIIYHDENGAIQRTGAQFSYAYHLFIKNSQLSFGLTANVFQYRINSDRAAVKNPETDPLNGLIGKSTLVPDAGIGINYMTEKAHIGLAVAQVFQSKLKIGNNEDFQSSEEIKLLRHYYLLADYRYSIPRHPDWELEPSGILLANEMLKFQADVTLKAYYKRQYWFGLSGRTSADFIIMAGLKFKNYYFGYSFDYGFKGLSRYSFGSHEICITAKFGDTARRYRWLNRY